MSSSRKVQYQAVDFFAPPGGNTTKYPTALGEVSTQEPPCSLQLLKHHKLSQEYQDGLLNGFDHKLQTNDYPTLETTQCGNFRLPDLDYFRAKTGKQSKLRTSPLNLTSISEMYPKTRWKIDRIQALDIIVNFFQHKIIDVIPEDWCSLFCRTTTTNSWANLQSKIDPKRVKNWFLFEKHITISAALVIKLYESANLHRKFNRYPITILELAKDAFKNNWELWCQRLSLAENLISAFPNALKGQEQVDSVFEYKQLFRNRDRYFRTDDTELISHIKGEYAVPVMLTPIPASPQSMQQIITEVARTSEISGVQMWLKARSAALSKLEESLEEKIEKLEELCKNEEQYEN